MIMTRAEWDQATKDGHVTAEHIVQRLQNVAAHLFDEEEAAVAFDDEGFVVSLTAASITVDGVKLHVYTLDHQPPHVHVKTSAFELRINLVTAELMGSAPRGVSAKQVRKLQDVVRENHPVLAGMWTSYHGGEPIARP
jgi:hypothetical protein